MSPPAALQYEKPCNLTRAVPSCEAGLLKRSGTPLYSSVGELWRVVREAGVVDEAMLKPRDVLERCSSRCTCNVQGK